MGQFEMVKDFFLGISRSRVSLIGAMVVTVTTPFLFGYMLADTVWHIKNPYFGAAIYLALGPLFLGGLAMVFIGAFFFRGDRDVHLFTLCQGDVDTVNGWITGAPDRAGPGLL